MGSMPTRIYGDVFLEISHYTLNGLMMRIQAGVELSCV